MINTQASNDKNVIVNLFIHEQKHYQDYLNKGYLEYTYGSGNTIARNTSVKATFDRMAEYGAITTQMVHPTWNKTSSNFKLGIANYATRLGLQIQGLNEN